MWREARNVCMMSMAITDIPKQVRSNVLIFGRKYIVGQSWHTYHVFQRQQLCGLLAHYGLLTLTPYGDDVQTVYSWDIVSLELPRLSVSIVANLCNSLCPSNTIWRNRYVPALVLILVSYPTARLPILTCHNMSSVAATWERVLSELLPHFPEDNV